MRDLATRATQSIRRGARTGWAALRRHPWIALSFIPLALLATAAAAAFYVMSLVPRTPGVSDLREIRVDRPSLLLSSDGKELAALRKTNREWVRLADISPHVLDALIATEDQRFYEHRGLRPAARTVGAAYNTLRGRLQGGSTITQQLARNLFPEEIGRQATVERKVKEAITALRIESVYRKDEILEIYLNTVPFLYNTYGIEMAARTYFDKTARELGVLESATLVGMLKGTTYYNPVLNPARAKQRRNIVLGQMARLGKLDGTQLAQLREQPLRLDFERPEEQLGPAPHFALTVRRWLIDWADRAGTTCTRTASWCAPRWIRGHRPMPRRLSRARPNGCRSWPTRPGTAATAGRRRWRSSTPSSARRVRTSKHAPADWTRHRRLPGCAVMQPSCASCAKTSCGCRPGWWPSSRAAGWSAPGSAAATSRWTSSTTSSRRAGNPVPPSSPSFTARRSLSARDRATSCWTRRWRSRSRAAITDCP